MKHRETCPTCKEIVSEPDDHLANCSLMGVDAVGLEERRESWLNEFRFESYREKGTANVVIE